MTSPLLSDITARLTSISATPALDSSVLIAHIVHKSRTWVIAHPELELTTEQHRQLEDSLARLERGESFPYVIGHWEFFGLDFKVTPDVLIPRPETELLVEKAITWLKKNPNKRSIADIGTGSGVIAISIAVNLPDAKILATDISSKALNVAKRNAEKHGVNKKIDFIECDLLPHSIDPRLEEEGAGVREINLICANLPYIPTETLRGLPVFGREPTLALDGGTTGFDLIQRLMQTVSRTMSTNSLVLFEIESTLGKEALDLANRMFPNAGSQLSQDLTGRDRLLEIELP